MAFLMSWQCSKMVFLFECGGFLDVCDVGHYSVIWPCGL